MGRSLMPKGASNEDRFWSHIIKASDPEDCWSWRGGNLKGYGIFHVRQEDGSYKTYRAHRYLFELINGPIPNGLEVLHRCDVPGCCNPRHLVLGTHFENMKDAAMKGRSYRKWLDDESVRRAKKYRAAGFSQTAIANVLGVRSSTISNLIRGKSHKEIRHTNTTTPENDKSANHPVESLACAP